MTLQNLFFFVNTMHELRSQHVFLLLSYSARSKQLVYFVQGQGEQRFPSINYVLSFRELEKLYFFIVPYTLWLTEFWNCKPQWKKAEWASFNELCSFHLAWGFSFLSPKYSLDDYETFWYPKFSKWQSHSKIRCYTFFYVRLTPHPAL